MITTILTLALMFIFVLSPALIPAVAHAAHAVSSRRLAGKLATA